MECDEVIIYIFKLSDNLVLLGNIRVLSKSVPKSFWVFLVNCVKITHNLIGGCRIDDLDLVVYVWIEHIPAPGWKTAIIENVNTPPWRKHTVIVQYYSMIMDVSCFLYIFATYR